VRDGGFHGQPDNMDGGEKCVVGLFLGDEMSLWRCREDPGRGLAAVRSDGRGCSGVVAVRRSRQQRRCEYLCGEDGVEWNC
jgi:hypothetical protein